MGIVLIDPATDFPVTLTEAKEHCFAGGTSDFNGLFDRLIRAATVFAEGYTGRSLAVKTWDLVLDAFADEIELPGGPVTNVTQVQFYDADGALQTLGSDTYLVDLSSNPQRLVLATGESWPATADRINAVTVRYIAGYAANVPEDIRQAILMLVAGWFQDREQGAPSQGALRLLDQHRRMVI